MIMFYVIGIGNVIMDVIVFILDVMFGCLGIEKGIM